MKLRVVYSALLVLAAVGAANHPALAGDWPHWLGPDRNGIGRETGLLKQWPAEGPKVLWQAPVGQGYSSVAVAGGRVFTQFQADKAQWAVAWDEKTGKELWKVRIGDENPKDYPGTRSTPSVDGDRVYELSANGDLHCLNVADGKLVWSKNLLKEFGAENLGWSLAMSPYVDSKLVYVATGQAKGASFVALDKMTGATVWTALDDPCGYSTPAVTEAGGVRQLLVYTTERITGLGAADGKLLWAKPWKTSYGVNAATPIARGDNVFVSSAYNMGSMLLKIDLKNTSEPATQVYQNKVLRSWFSTPVLIDNYVYGFDADKSLKCMQFDTGAQKWEGPAFKRGSLAVADGLAYILGEDGELALARLGPEKYEPISSVKGLVGPRCWSAVVVANGRLYIRDETKLLCLDVAEKK